MNLPSRAARESATTTRYAGFRVVPVRLSLMWTATRSPLSGLCCAAVERRSARQEGQRALELAHAPLHLLEPLHHLLELRVLLGQPVHVRHAGAAAAGDPSAAAAADDSGRPPHALGRHSPTRPSTPR